MKYLLIIFTAILAFTACNTQPENPISSAPEIEEFSVGEQWTWDWKRTVDGEVLGQGSDTHRIVNDRGALGLYNGFDTIPLHTLLAVEESETPFQDWPLEVGKTWVFETEWTNEAGNKGRTRQNAKVESFDQLTTKAGEFFAFKVVYTGTIENFSGGKGEVTDTWWYAPRLKKHIKHVQDDGYGLYTSELSEYVKP